MAAKFLELATGQIQFPLIELKYTLGVTILGVILMGQFWTYGNCNVYQIQLDIRKQEFGKEVYWRNKVGSITILMILKEMRPDEIKAKTKQKPAK